MPSLEQAPKEVDTHFDFDRADNAIEDAAYNYEHGGGSKEDRELVKSVERAEVEALKRARE